MKDARQDGREGSMADIQVTPLPPGQARALERCRADWSAIPLGVHSLILRALVDRGLVETRWANPSIQQWRRAPPKEGQ